MKKRSSQSNGGRQDIRQRLPAAERKKQLISAAQRVFVRQGFHGTRTKDLAEEADVNEATFFMHFASKQEIFDAAVTDQLRSLVKLQLQEGRAFATAEDLKIKDQIGFQAIKEIYEAVVEMSPLLVTALFSSRDEGRQAYRDDVYPLIRRLRAASKVSFQLNDDTQSEFIALAAMGLCFSMHIHHQMLGLTADPDVIAARISNLLLRGAFESDALRGALDPSSPVPFGKTHVQT